MPPPPTFEKKLFAIYIGGRLEQAHIELHDMRFIVAERIEATYPELRRQWWGIPKTLHIDCWAELTHADGYRIRLKSEPSSGAERLYYVNLGGYTEKEFTELHKNSFVVAETPGKAKIKALKTIRHWDAPHKDDLHQIDDVFCLNLPVCEQSLHIHLEKIDDDSPPAFTCYYNPIGKSGS